MASTAPTSLRRLLEEKFSELIADAEELVGAARDLSRRECADQLNQSVRRIRQAADPDELIATLVDLAASFAGGAAVLRVDGEIARVERIRAPLDPAVELLPNREIPLASAPALAGALETRDPVVAVASAGEVSEILVSLLGQSSGDRVSIFPIVADDRGVGLLYVWGTVQGAALELLAQVAGAAWIEPAAPEPPPPPVPELVELVTIAPVTVVSGPPEAPSRAQGWDSLSPDEQRIHLRAQRYARVQVAEMRLLHADAVQSGRAHRELYGALRQHIDAAREGLRQLFFATCPSMVDYLHLELLRTLANDDPELLGKDYPGPLV